MDTYTSITIYELLQFIKQATSQSSILQAKPSLKTSYFCSMYENLYAYDTAFASTMHRSQLQWTDETYSILTLCPRV